MCAEGVDSTGWRWRRTAADCAGLGAGAISLGQDNVRLGHGVSRVGRGPKRESVAGGRWDSAAEQTGRGRDGRCNGGIGFGEWPRPRQGPTLMTDSPATNHGRCNNYLRTNGYIFTPSAATPDLWDLHAEPLQ